jgi:hypothetical protein
MINKVKGKIVPELNKLSITPWRRLGEWMYRSKNDKYKNKNIKVWSAQL